MNQENSWFANFSIILEGKIKNANHKGLDSLYIYDIKITIKFVKLM